MASSRSRLLIVEERPDDREFLVRALRGAGLDFVCLCVASIREVEEALAQPWDAVLCGEQLGDVGAPAVLALLEERGLDLPFIVVSSAPVEEAPIAAMRAGAHDVFAKGRLTGLRAAIERELAAAAARADRRQAEAERNQLLDELPRALAARDEFLVLASHELRTPLTILGLQLDSLVRSLSRAGTPPPAGVTAMRRQLDWFGALLDRCVDVTKLSSEPLVLSKRATDLRAVVLDAVDRSRDWIDQAGCPLVLEPLDSIVGHWDPVRLDSVITNLLANALKYGRGQPVAISTRRDGHWAVLTVKDRGIGVSEDQQAGLFDKSSRAVPSSNYGGLGLGLWVVDRITHAHDGTVQLESRRGEGATFTVRLPLASP